MKQSPESPTTAREFPSIRDRVTKARYQVLAGLSSAFVAHLRERADGATNDMITEFFGCFPDERTILQASGHMLHEASEELWSLLDHADPTALDVHAPNSEEWTQYCERKASLRAAQNGGAQ
jgi:hypothetical protein